MGRDKKKADDGLPPVPGWVVTYGDMMSLLLTFFVLLLSFSTVSEQDFNEAMMSLQGAFGFLNQQDGLISSVPRPPREAKQRMEQLARELQRRMQVQGADQKVKIRFDQSGGLKIVLPNGILFDSGSTDLKPEAFELLQEVAKLLAALPGLFIEVRGHSDNRPVGGTGGFRDNFDLSYFRADAVARRLSSEGAIPLAQFEVVACGDGQPIATNETEGGRAANRRVELVVRGLLDQERTQELREQFEALPEQPQNTPATTVAPNL